MHASFGTLQGLHTQLGRDPFDPGRDYIVKQLGRLYFISHLERGGGKKINTKVLGDRKSVV